MFIGLVGRMAALKARLKAHGYGFEWGCWTPYLRTGGSGSGGHGLSGESGGTGRTGVHHHLAPSPITISLVSIGSVDSQKGLLCWCHFIRKYQNAVIQEKTFSE